ncbi:ROK family protein [Brachybacterium sp. GCM10030252]|uniref:ROK family protein n=1 Tax=Brachybacterium sp. GCM10030252 TaxID=3273380 RepID=UPI00360D8239
MAHADRAALAVRQANSRECLLALREAAAPLALAEIASRTGLSRPTVASVLQELEGAGSVQPAAPAEPGQPGRPARRYAFRPAAATAAAVDIGSHSVRCLLADASGQILMERTVAAEDGSRLPAAVEAIRSTGHRPSSVAVAVPGILAADGRLAQSLALPDLVGIDVADELEQQLECPVVVENDIKLAAYAERHLGPPADSIAFVQIGHRISVALIVEGVILQGSHRLAGELGIQRGMRWTESSRRGRLTWSTGEDARPLFERAAAGDAAAEQEIDAFCAEIAPRLVTVLLSIDPELVVVGGGVSRAGDTLLDPLRRHIHHLLMAPERPDVVAARLTTDGSLVGALGRAFEHGSTRLVGVPDVPPPWTRFLAPAPDTAPAPAPAPASAPATAPTEG